MEDPAASATTGTTSTEALDQVATDIAAECPEIAASPTSDAAKEGAGVALPAMASAPSEQQPPFTPQTLREALEGAVMAAGTFHMLTSRGIPKDVLDLMFDADHLDPFCVRGARLANKYNTEALKWLQFWAKYQDEILFLGIDVPALAVHAFKVYRQWSIEEEKRKPKPLRPVDRQRQQVEEPDPDEENSSAADDETET